MHHNTQLVPFKIDAIISHTKPVQGPACALQFPKFVQFGLHDLLGKSAKFPQDLQLQFLRHFCQFSRAGRVKDDLERAQSNRELKS